MRDAITGLFLGYCAIAIVWILIPNYTDIAWWRAAIVAAGLVAATSIAYYIGKHRGETNVKLWTKETLRTFVTKIEAANEARRRAE